MSEQCKIPLVNSLINEELTSSYYELAIFTSIAVVLGALVIYCLYNIGIILKFYYDQKFKYKNIKQPTTNNAFQPHDDNEEYVQSQAQQADRYDDYAQFSKQIDKSIEDYKSYNAQLQQFYNENRPGETPQDLIDRSILESLHDDY